MLRVKSEVITGGIPKVSKQLRDLPEGNNRLTPWDPVIAFSFSV